MKKRYKFWLGLFISGFFIYLFIRGMDIKEVWRATQEANYFFILASIGINILAFMIRAERWKYFLGPMKKVRFRSLFSAVCIGFMGNSLLPARAGEFIRAYVIGKREKISKTSSFATIVIERIFDGLTLLVMLIFVVALFPFPTTGHRSFITIYRLKMAVVICSFLYGMVISVLILLSWKPRQVWEVVHYSLLRFFPEDLGQKINVLYTSFVVGLESLKRGRHMLTIAIYSVVLWLVTAFGIYLLFPAFSMQLDLFSGIIIMVIVAVIVMLPSSPGFVGTFHLASSEALILLGISVNRAKTFAIVHHAVCIIPVTLLGLFYLSREHISFAEIQTSAKKDLNTIEKGEIDPVQMV